MTNDNALTVHHANTAPMDLLRWRDFREATQVAEYLSKSTMIPVDYQGRPANIIIAMDYASRLGSGLFATMQGLAVINGRPCLWGDLMLAVVLRSPLCERITERFDDATMTATCEVKRAGWPTSTVTWTIDDAKRAQLWGKKGPWTTYPKRMLGLRARAWALRNAFSDVVLGLQCAEEVRDYAVRGSDSAATREPEYTIEVPASDKWIVDAAFEERPIAHAPDTSPEDEPKAQPEVQPKAQPKSQPETRESKLPDVLAYIEASDTLAELHAVKPLFRELTADERRLATDAGRAKRAAIEEAAFALAQQAAVDASIEVQQ